MGKNTLSFLVEKRFGLIGLHSQCSLNDCKALKEKSRAED
jgi:hypothetical protein